jgi:hypothetical protein
MAKEIFTMTTSIRLFLVFAGIAFGATGGVTSALAQGVSASPAAATSSADTTELRQRAAAFWAARVAGDADTQWKLLEPRGKGRMTPQEYAAAPTGGRYLAYQVEGATVNGLFATVKVKVLVQQMLPIQGPSRILPPQTVVVDDGWIQVGGTWYRQMDDGQKGAGEEKQPTADVKQP